MRLLNWLFGNRKRQNTDTAAEGAASNTATDGTASNTAADGAGPSNTVAEGAGGSDPATEGGGAMDAATASVLAAARVGFITRDFAHLTKSTAAQAMTREAWLACTDPLAMLCFLHGRASGRKFRLFATACARDEFAHGTIPERECPPRLLPRYYDAIVAAEAFADGGPALSYGGILHWAAHPVCDVITDEDVAHGALGFDADTGLWLRPIEQVVPETIRRYRTHPAHYLRDIFGSVFHQAPLNSTSRTDTVLAIAEAAYEDRHMPVGHLHLDRLAVLADALEEAGCTDADILAHLRGPGPHVRGCWALDLTMGKA